VSNARAVKRLLRVSVGVAIASRGGRRRSGLAISSTPCRPMRAVSGARGVALSGVEWRSSTGIQFGIEVVVLLTWSMGLAW
jgi:hypothetical protein